MADSTFIIYRNNITPDRNALVDDISNALGTIKASFNHFQYLKIALNMNVKVNLNQYNVGKAVGNYCAITQDNKTYYFFITNATWKAQETVELTLYMDTINTFRNDLTFNAKTHITRKHVNRFYNTPKFEVGTNYLISKVDDVNEGMQPIKYKVDDIEIQESRSASEQAFLADWYLVYKTPDTPTSESPIRCILVPQNPIKMSNIRSTDTRILTATNRYQAYIWRDDNPEDLTINGFGFTNTRQILLVSTLTTPLLTPSGIYGGNINADGSITWTFLQEVAAGTPTTQTNMLAYRLSGNDVISNNINNIKNIERIILPINYMPSIKEIDRTDSRNIKIVALPYLPIDNVYYESGNIIHLPDNWKINPNDSFLELEDLSSELGKRLNYSISPDDALIQLINIKEINNIDEVLNEDRYFIDPKLLHSDFNTIKLVYDSYSTDIDLEKLISIHRYNYLSIYYKPSNTISSNILFKIIDDLGATNNYISKEDYNRMFISTRNNESPIYTNAYLNYTRTGYNFDRKAQSQNLFQSLLGIGTSGVSVGLSATRLSEQGITGLGALSILGQGITNLTQGIFSIINSETAIQQKIAEAKAQATQISGSDDLNLMKYYTNNKLHWMRYRCNQKLQDLLDDLFYYSGYARDEQAIPTMNNRYWFDYIRCEPIFNEEADTPYQEYIKDIKARYSIGVTVYHYHNGYDWAQVKENWENVLLN